MSGGYFDYKQMVITDIIDDIEQVIALNDCQELDSYGDKIGREYAPEIIAEFKKAIHALLVAQVYAHRIDWLLSCDDSPEAFLRRLESDLKEIKL